MSQNRDANPEDTLLEEVVVKTKKVLPGELTSYDLLKSLAIVLMIIDHTGHHFYPDDMWFRVMGRWCVPIWFFLIGYAKTDHVPKKLWIGGFIVAGSALVSGQYLVPLNILFTMIVLRFMRRGVLLQTFYSAETLRGMFLILLFLTIPSAILFEYGAISMMFVLLGHMVRYRKDIEERIRPLFLFLFFFAVFFSFFVLQGVGFPILSEMQAIVLFLGFIPVAVMLWFFKSVTYPQARSFMAGSFISLFQFMGRRTLEIYVVHILLFRGIMMYLHPKEYAFLEWNYVPPGLLSFFGVN